MNGQCPTNLQESYPLLDFFFFFNFLEDSPVFGNVPCRGRAESGVDSVVGLSVAGLPPYSRGPLSQSSPY